MFHFSVFLLFNFCDYTKGIGADFKKNAAENEFDYY